MECSTPGFPVHHQLPELTQTQIHQVSGAIQPSHPLKSPSLPAFNIPSIRVFLSHWVVGYSVTHNSELIHLTSQAFVTSLLAISPFSSYSLTQHTVNSVNTLCLNSSQPLYILFPLSGMPFFLRSLQNHPWILGHPQIPTPLLTSLISLFRPKSSILPGVTTVQCAQTPTLTTEFPSSLLPYLSLP